MLVTINTDASFSKRLQRGSYAFWITSDVGRIKQSGLLKNNMPSPEIYDINKSFSPIGRKALLSSLKPGTVVTKYHDTNNLSTQHWAWDGEQLTSTDAGFSFPIVDYSECVVTIKPEANTYVVITSEAQVDADTVYVD